jgi:hypothetical protein
MEQTIRSQIKQKEYPTIAKFYDFLKKSFLHYFRGPENMYDCAGEDQQLFNRPID